MSYSEQEPKPNETPPTLSRLADAVRGTIVSPDAFIGGVVSLSGLAYDSRQVKPGFLFVAVAGARFDGNEFVREVVASGASAVVLQADRAGEFADLPVPRIVVPDARAALAPLACAFYGNPTHDLFLTGVTGTNGKTTTTLMIDAIGRAYGDTTGTIGTLGATIRGRALPGDRTTPEAPDLQRLFREMRDEGVETAAMEVASHALALGRTEGCAFDVGVFTNLTQDHLDFHQTMEGYRDAKARLFTDYADTAKSAGKSFTAVLNIDNAAGRHYAERTRAARTLTYSPSGDARADLRARDIRPAVEQLRFAVDTPDGPLDVYLGFGGDFNVANALAAIGYGLARGLSLEDIETGLGNCAAVPGRFQPVRAGQDFAVLVDYAHTPDGMDNVLRSARALTTGRLIAVFGCGGDRDRTKRPLMGKIALDLSDVAIVTLDNPRTEEPSGIIDDILTGMNGPGARIIREPDRRTAITLAVNEAEPGDTIVIAGKGHESYQIVGHTTYPFDDVSTAEVAIRARNSEKAARETQL